MPTVRDYLISEGLSEDELAARVGVKPTTVEKRGREGAEMPLRWQRELGLIEGDPGGKPGRPPADEPSENGRQAESTPRRPAGAKVAPPKPPEGFDASTLAGYIEGAYRLGAHAIADTDPLLSGAIDSHAEQAGQAWAKWAESEPRVVALLERLMVTTPAGEVIGVHVSIAFAYFLARSAVQRAERDARLAAARAEREEQGGDEPAEAAAPDYVGGALG